MQAPPAPVIYAIAGKIGVGKDFVGAALVAELIEHMAGAEWHMTARPMLLALGDGLKHHILREHPDILYDEVFDRKTPRSRHLLQTVAMEIREKHGDDAWVKELLNVINIHFKRGNATHFVVTDMRFLVEARALKERGATIVLLDAPMRNRAKLEQESGGDPAKMAEFAAHVSETQVDSPEFRELVTQVIDNDSGAPFVLKYMLANLVVNPTRPSRPQTAIAHMAVRHYILLHAPQPAETYHPSTDGNNNLTSTAKWSSKAVLSIETDAETYNTDLTMYDGKQWARALAVPAGDYIQLDDMVDKITAAANPNF